MHYSTSSHIPFVPLQRARFQSNLSPYTRFVKKLVDWLIARDRRFSAFTLAAFLLEPYYTLKAGLILFLGWKRHFNFYGLNPQILTREQAEQRPILLLHGNYHNQSAWLAFAPKLSKAQLGPIYTVNLTSGRFNDRKRRIVNEKIEQIQAHYRAYGKEEIQIDLVGYSQGGQMAYYMSFDKESWRINKRGKVYFKNGPIRRRREIGQVIQIGEAISHTDLVHHGMSSDMYEILGQQDIIAANRSRLDPLNHLLLNCGHVALLYADAAHQQVIRWLRAARPSPSRAQTTNQ